MDHKSTEIRARTAVETPFVRAFSVAGFLAAVLGSIIYQSFPSRTPDKTANIEFEAVHK
jgi:ribose/xylose/arabinose/galactoside ABC-type transport system permease subunit